MIVLFLCYADIVPATLRLESHPKAALGPSLELVTSTRSNNANMACFIRLVGISMHRLANPEKWPGVVARSFAHSEVSMLLRHPASM